CHATHCLTTVAEMFDNRTAGIATSLRFLDLHTQIRDDPAKETIDRNSVASAHRWLCRQIRNAHGDRNITDAVWYTGGSNALRITNQRRVHGNGGRILP